MNIDIANLLTLKVESVPEMCTGAGRATSAPRAESSNAAGAGQKLPNQPSFARTRTRQSRAKAGAPTQSRGCGTRLHAHAMPWDVARNLYVSSIVVRVLPGCVN